MRTEFNMNIHSLLLCLVSAIFLSGSHSSMAQTRQPTDSVFKSTLIPLPDHLHSRIYDTMIVADRAGQPHIVASSPESIFLIDGDNVEPLVTLARGNGSYGESAILPSWGRPLTLEEMKFGLLIHNHHAIGHFRLINASGETLSDLDDSRHFHYRLSPSNTTFVGIDSHGKHAALAAARVTYRLFDAQTGNKLLAEFESHEPARNDSSYSLDGNSFLINSDQDGLQVVSTVTGKSQYKIPFRVREFIAANADLLLISHEDERNKFSFYKSGNLQFSDNLKAIGGEGNIRNLNLSPSGNYAVISDARHVFIYTLEGHELVGNIAIDQGMVINSLAVTDAGIVAVGAQSAKIKGNQSAAGAVYISNAKGEVIKRIDTQHKRTNAWIPTVQFDARGNTLLIKTMEALQLVSVSP